MMSLKLTFDLYEESAGNYTGWINEVDGVIAQGKSKEEVKEELLKILRIKWELERTEKLSSRTEKCNTLTEEMNFQLA